MIIKTIALMGTFDSKGPEFLFAKEWIEAQGFQCLTIHTGTFDPYFPPDISNNEVASAAGYDLSVLKEQGRGICTAAMAQGAQNLIPQLYRQGRFDGIFSMGGGGGTAAAAPAMQALPIGVPKVIISTLAAGDTTPYIGISDLVLFPALLDIAGMNQLTEKVISNALSALAGMLIYGGQQVTERKKPVVAATMFGVTTACVERARKELETAGFEVWVFHATGSGGKLMERLISDGHVDGVLDLTTTELCDDLFGGVLTAGPDRLLAAGSRGVPQVVSVGAMDMVNFGPMDSVPEKYQQRKFFAHTPAVTLMRTTEAENRILGEHLAKKLNAAQGTTILMLPNGGVSAQDKPGQAFHDPAADKALFDSLRQHLDSTRVQTIEMQEHINDEAFAVTAAKELIAAMKIREGYHG